MIFAEPALESITSCNSCGNECSGLKFSARSVLIDVTVCVSQGGAFGQGMRSCGCIDVRLETLASLN